MSARTIKLADYFTVADAVKEAQSQGTDVSASEIRNAILYHRALDSIKVGTARLVLRSSFEAWLKGRDAGLRNGEQGGSDVGNR